VSIGYPPKYRYLLPDDWDKEVFSLISAWAKDKQYPKILGSNEEKNKYLTMLIRSQKAFNNWRDLPKDTISQINLNGNIDAAFLNKKYPPSWISREIPAWATYQEDKLVSDFIDELETRKVNFIGTDQQTGEFILRFILGQLGDWEVTILMISEMLGSANEIRLSDLNNELKNFDYAKLFKE